MTLSIKSIRGIYYTDNLHWIIRNLDENRIFYIKRINSTTQIKQKTENFSSSIIIFNIYKKYEKILKL